MAFFNSSVGALQTPVIVLGASPDIRGAICYRIPSNAAPFTYSV